MISLRLGDLLRPWTLGGTWVTLHRSMNCALAQERLHSESHARQQAVGQTTAGRLPSPADRTVLDPFLTSKSMREHSKF